MSFNDIAMGSSSSGQGGAGGMRPMAEQRGDGMQILVTGLQKYNQSANALKQFMASARPGRNVSELDAKIKLCRDCETNVKVQLSIQVKKLANEPKSAVAQKRLAVSKLQKDFERVQVNVQGLVDKAAHLRTDTGRGEMEVKATNNGVAIGGGTAGAGAVSFSKIDDGPRVIQKLQGYEVDEAIAEERERDIIKINEDLKLVNEMFKDVAQLVEEQNAPIESIVESTSQSHARAEAGLEQVQQAARYQPGCVLC
jgi:hypothetical protein